MNHIKNLFQKILTSLFEGKITRMIEQDYGIPLHEIETNSRKSIEESLNKEPYPGLKLHGKVLELRPSQFLVGQNHITAVITTSASLQLKISGLSF